MTLQANETLQNGPFQGIFDEAGAFVGFLNPRANGADLRIGGYAPVSGSFTTLTVSGQASFADGTAAAPSVKIGDEQNGFYSPSANVLGVTINGIAAARFSSTSAAGAQYFDFTYNSGINENKLVAAGTANLGFSSTGGGLINFYTNVTLEKQVEISRTANASRWLTLTGSNGGSPAIGTSAGDLLLSPGGGAVVSFGTHSAIAAETVTGYITIKDAAGNSRKLAVVS